MVPIEIVIKSLVAGILASLACGLGVFPLLIKRLDPSKHTGIAYVLAGGLMFSASVYNLILPGLTLSSHEIRWEDTWPVLVGMLFGAFFLSLTNTYLTRERLEQRSWKRWGSKAEILIFIAMAVHSIPEGVAVGVGYASEAIYDNALGTYMAVAIGIHNIPEGLAVAIPMRAAGSSIHRTFWAAVLTSIPQPIAAVPASMASWIFQPLMPVFMGFAAGAMVFLVILEIIPDALEEENPQRIAWAFTTGFCLMLLIQVLL
ncbi:MAG: ZIP family metal transporter [Calditrichota bacterium]